MHSSFISSQQQLSRISYISENLEQNHQLSSQKQLSHHHQNDKQKNIKNKNINFKIKKYQSIQTDNSQTANLQQQQRKFIDSYKNDIFYKKKIDFFIRDHEKRLKQNKIVKNVSVQHKKYTWRAQKLSNLQDFISQYDKYKKWINKIENCLSQQ